MKRNLLFLSALLLLVVSCEQEALVWTGFTSRKIPGMDSPVNLKTPEYEMTYQFSEEVIRLEGNDLVYLIRVEENETVVLDADIPERIKPVVGSILSADVSDKAPFGLGNRVLSVRESDGMFLCETEVAALDEVFSVLEINAAFELLNPEELAILDEEGNPYKLGNVYLTEDGELTDEDVKAPLVVNRMVKIPFPKASKGFFIDGYLGFGAKFIVAVSLSQRTFEISLEPSYGLDFSVGLTGEKILKEHWGDAQRFTVFPRASLVNGFIQLGPVTLRPYVDTYVYLETKVKGEGALHFGKGGSVKLGWNEKGKIYEPKTVEGNEGFFKGFTLDGKLAFGPTWEFDFGLGLWTKRIAAEIVPSAYFEVGAELELTANENSWRLDPKAYVDFALDANGRALIDFFGFCHLTGEMSFAHLPLWEKSWSLLPWYDETSATVDFRKGVSPIVFDAQYRMTGGLMSAFGVVYPALRIFRGGELIKVLDNSTRMALNSVYTPSFVITGLEQDVSYTAKPSIMIGEVYFDKDGIPFSSTTPTAAVTDIVQTGSDHGAFYFNGYDYEYIFEFYVSSYIKGSANCQEWGIYDPESVDTYNPNPLEDGRVTQYWTGWANTPSATWTKTPYAILQDGSTKYYEQHSHTCSYGGGGPVMNLPAKTSFADKPMVARLDSVAINGKTIYRAMMAE